MIHKVRDMRLILGWTWSALSPLQINYIWTSLKCSMDMPICSTFPVNLRPSPLHHAVHIDIMRLRQNLTIYQLHLAIAKFQTGCFQIKWLLGLERQISTGIHKLQESHEERHSSGHSWFVIFLSLFIFVFTSVRSTCVLLYRKQKPPYKSKTNNWLYRFKNEARDMCLQKFRELFYRF